MPSSTYTALATITLTGTDTEVVFGSIPSGYRDLVLVINGSVNFAGADSTIMRFNGDTGSNYSNVRMVGTGSAATSYADTAAYAYIGVEVDTSRFTIVTQIMDYSATDKHKTLLSRGNQAAGWVTGFASRWANTSAITSVSVLANASGSVFQAGSTFSLYGIAS